MFEGVCFDVKSTCKKIQVHVYQPLNIYSNLILHQTLVTILRQHYIFCLIFIHIYLSSENKSFDNVGFNNVIIEEFKIVCQCAIDSLYFLYSMYLSCSKCMHARYVKKFRKSN